MNFIEIAPPTVNTRNNVFNNLLYNKQYIMQSVFCFNEIIYNSFIAQQSKHTCEFYTFYA